MPASGRPGAAPARGSSRATCARGRLAATPGRAAQARSRWPHHPVSAWHLSWVQRRATLALMPTSSPRAARPGSVAAGAAAEAATRKVAEPAARAVAEPGARAVVEPAAEAVAAAPGARTAAGAARPKTRVRREPARARYDPESVHRALDRALVAHVAFVDGGLPYCIPTLHARIGDQLLIHGSSASRMTRLLSTGVPACVTVTSVDGIVLARSVFEHSVNYESVSVFGSFRALDDASSKLAALEAFTERLLPGRWGEARAPDRRELKATRVLSLEISRASVKLRQGGPGDDGTPDAELDIWAGVLPLALVWGQPQPSPGLRPGIPLAPSVAALGSARQPARALASRPA